MDDVWTSNMYDSSLVCLTDVLQKSNENGGKQGGVKSEVEIMAC